MAWRRHTAGVFQFPLRRGQGTAPDRRKKSRQGFLAPFQFAPIGMAVLPCEHVLNVGKFDLRGRLLNIHRGNAGQMRLHAMNRRYAFRSALFQDCFGLFTETFQIDGAGHSTTS
jgi:hypothetical protein